MCIRDRINIDQTAAGAGCDFSLTPTEVSVDYLAHTVPVTVSVTQGSTCSWATLSSSSWVTVAAGGSQTGPGTVVLAVGVNPGPGRAGFVTIAGKSFRVFQESAGCQFVVTPADQDLPASGGEATITVSLTQGIAEGCAWYAFSYAPFAAIVSGSQGHGAGTVRLSVSPNTGPQRSGEVRVAIDKVTITQRAAGSQHVVTDLLEPLFHLKRR